MTLIEVLIAILLLAVGALAVVRTFDSSRRLATDAEIRDVAATIARGEIERIEALPWASIALAAAPAKNAGAGTSDPTYYISTGPCAGSSNPPSSSPCYEWDWTSSIEPIVVSAATTDKTENPNPWSEVISTSNGSVRVSGSVYRFITWVNDPKCKAAACGGANDYKRITVAVTSSRLKAPEVLSTLWVNPVGGKADPLQQATVKCLDSGSLVPCTH